MPDDFQLAGNEKFEQAWYKAELVFFAIMALFVTAGLLGLFGAGLLSRTRVALPSGAGVVEYERFLRNQGQSRIKVDVPALAGQNNTVRFDHTFLAHADVQAASPIPVRMVSEGTAVEYIFASAPGRPTHLEFRFSAQGLGPFTAILTIDGSSLVIHSFIFP